MLLNPSSINYLSDNDINVHTDSGLIVLLPPLDPECDFYYIEFKKVLHHVATAIPGVVLEKLRNDSRTHLVLCNSHEAFHEVVREIYQHVVIGLCIPENKIILISESADIKGEILSESSRLQRPPFRSMWSRIFEKSCNDYLEHIMQVPYINTPRWVDVGSPLMPVTLVDKVYDKKFLNFNRRWRLHRPIFVALLNNKNLLDKGYVSLAPCDDQNDWAKMWPWIMGHHRFTEIVNILENKKEETFAIPPLYLDTDELMTNQAAISNTSDYLYENTYFSIVSETNFYSFTPGRFISEKIFKPVLFQHPFLVLSRPQTLELMRDIGYKTFGPWIDERYDEEIDDTTRMLMVVAETERLSNLTSNELTEFLNGVREICKFNFDVLLKKTKFSSDIE